VECRKDADVTDETPAAYKNIDAVMEAQKDLVDVAYTLKEVVCSQRAKKWRAQIAKRLKKPFTTWQP